MTNFPLNFRDNTYHDLALKLKSNLIEQINARNRDILQRYPISQYCMFLRNYPKIGSYQYLSLEAKTLYNKVLKESDAETVELYHKLVIIQLIVESKAHLEVCKFPEKINEWYQISFQMILKKISNNQIHKGSYLYPQNRFFKDLGVCRLKLIPAGVRKLHLERLPVKRFLFKNGVRHTWEGLRYIASEFKGLQPVFHGHMDVRDKQSIAEFCQDGWIRHYKLLAELLKIYPEVKGAFGLSWFYDPHLSKISPDLSYLRELVVNNGGKIFYAGISEQAIKNATRLSLKRKRLYAEGKYFPRNYVVVWSREKILRWANNQ